ncbi:uncharacterized protein G2W53_031177 [Senna tora]|uniref:Uncharacterized protein n=1 Tax=Senna tora TaxID=362788 RepID=A0A834T7I8_9FABA|nr:uncharacterized protein G2W53_031177 [Senna tora]
MTHINETLEPERTNANATQNRRAQSGFLEQYRPADTWLSLKLKWGPRLFLFWV